MFVTLVPVLCQFCREPAAKIRVEEIVTMTAA